MTKKFEFKNFTVLTVDIHSVEHKTSKEGRPYALASASLPMEKGEPMPLRIVTMSEPATSIARGRFTLIGRLGYDEKGDEGIVVLFPMTVEEPPADGKLRNFVNLTLRAGQEAEGRYSEGGKFWARVRMALSQGKNEDGSYKPSLWLTVKGFTSKEGVETIPQTLSKLNKGDLAVISGRLTYDVSSTNGKGYINLIAFDVEALQPAYAEGDVTEDCPY